MPQIAVDPRKTLLNLKVRTPEKVIYEGNARAVTSVNERGIFDVLPAHQNFITLISEKLSIVDAQGEKQDFSVQGGVMKVYENNVSIFLGLEAMG